MLNLIQSHQSGRRRNKSDELLSISISNRDHDDEKSTTGIDGRFLHSQLLIACLRRMKTTLTDKSEFISRCREIYKEENSQLKIINEFEQDYVSEHSLWWYTRETFLYRLLNKALRIQNIDLLFLFRFFIRDIEKELRQRRYRSAIRLYRGQLMSVEELNVLKNSIDKFISINSFLSTTYNLKMALMYLGSPAYDSSSERVLFEINADASQNDVKPFADLSQISFFPEDEILMMLGSVFRLNKIYLGDNQIWHIEMNLCSDNHCDLKATFHVMNNQYSANNTQLLLFGNVLIDMGNFDNAEKYLCRLLEQLPSQHQDLYKCYQALGKISCEKGNYDLGLDYLNKSLEILQKIETNSNRIGYIYNNIGEVYQKKGDIRQALDAYKKAFLIFKQTPDDDQQSIAWCYNNLGIIYGEQKEYFKARDYLTKALSIKTKLLPAGHPCLSNTYNNLGNIHYHLQEYDQALEKYKFAFEIFKKSLQRRHPSIARTLKNIGICYEAKKDFIEAKMYYEKAGEIRKMILSSSHPDLIEIKNDIARVSSKIT